MDGTANLDDVRTEEVPMRISRIFIVMMFVFSSLSFAEEPMPPMAEFGVHAVVTLGTTIYEGEKIRAVLTYGEVGTPSIFIEAIKVKEGYPVQSKVLWREKINVTGGLGDVCPIAEYWCGYIKELRWKNNTLQYEIKTGSHTYLCNVNQIGKGTSKSSCRIK
jgi:hypothetical protein